MARAVLGALLALTACGRRSATQVDVPPGAVACPALLGAVAADVQATYEAFRSAVEAGPLLRAAVRHARDGLQCRARADDSAVVVEYVSTGGTRLIARRDSTIELTDEQLVLPGLTLAEGTALLREVESDRFGDEGCGIEWGRSSVDAANGRQEITYRGSVCNCRGTVVLRPDGRNEVHFVSAC